VPGTCASCGRHDEDTTAIYRVYVTPEAWDTPGRVTRLDEVEQWCFACRSSYPHEDASAGDEPPVEGSTGART
jgi:hypothetical protein